MANETWKFVQAKSKQAIKQVLGIKNDAARMKVTPPLAVAPSGSSGHEHGPTPQVAATAQTGGARRRAARPAHTSVFVC